MTKLQKQPPGVFNKKVVPQNFRNIHWKTPLLESLFKILKRDSNASVFLRLSRNF